MPELDAAREPGPSGPVPRPEPFPGPIPDPTPEPFPPTEPVPGPKPILRSNQNELPGIVLYSASGWFSGAASMKAGNASAVSAMRRMMGKGVISTPKR